MSWMRPATCARSMRALQAVGMHHGLISRRMYSVNAENLLDKFASTNPATTEQKRQAQMNKYSEKLLAKAKECVSLTDTDMA